MWIDYSVDPAMAIGLGTCGETVETAAATPDWSMRDLTARCDPTYCLDGYSYRTHVYVWVRSAFDGTIRTFETTSAPSLGLGCRVPPVRRLSATPPGGTTFSGGCGLTAVTDPTYRPDVFYGPLYTSTAPNSSDASATVLCEIVVSGYTVYTMERRGSGAVVDSETAAFTAGAWDDVSVCTVVETSSPLYGWERVYADAA